MYSPPATNRSANTVSSTARAAAYAAGSASAVFTLLMPTLEPCDAGLTIIGRPISSSARARSASAASVVYGGTRQPAPAATSFVFSLSIVSEAASTPLPVYGNPSHSSAP